MYILEKYTYIVIKKQNNILACQCFQSECKIVAHNAVGANINHQTLSIFQSRTYSACASGSRLVNDTETLLSIDHV